MRIAIVFPIIGVFFLAIACQSNEDTTPNPNVVVNIPGVTNTNNKPNTTVTNQEVYDQFVRLALKTTDGKQSSTIKKWAPTFTQVKIFWDSGSDATLLKNLDKVITDINSLSQSNKFVRTSVAAEAHITINRATAAAHDQKYPQFKVNNSNMSGETYTVWGSSGIQKSVVWLSPTAVSTVITGVIRHELLHALGLGHTENNKSLMIPVMNATIYDFNTFSTLDKSIVAILQDSRVKHGQSESNISSVIKEYATKASSMRISGEGYTIEMPEIKMECHFIEAENYLKATNVEK